MSYLDRISNTQVGSGAGAYQFGWIGDSICIADFLGSTGQGTTNQRLSFASIVSSYYGGIADNNGVSGQILSSFLPYQSAAVGGAVANFDGEWLLDGSQWYWWNPLSGGSWVAVTTSANGTNKNGVYAANLTALTSNIFVHHIFIAQSGVNDNAANIAAGGSDADAHGSYHYTLLMNEIITRIKAANKTAMIVSGTTSADPDFHGVPDWFLQESTGRYSEAARQSALTNKVSCCDVGLRLNIELSLGRVDILTRNSQMKPTSFTQPDWDAYLAATGDASAATNPYRVFDETEDDLHETDTTRSVFFYNLHPNAFGHYVIANEIIKFFNEKGLR